MLTRQRFLQHHAEAEPIARFALEPTRSDLRRRVRARPDVSPAVDAMRRGILNAIAFNGDQIDVIGLFAPHALHLAL